MKHRNPFSTLTGAVPTLVAASALFAAGCESQIGPDGGNPGVSGTSGSAGTAGTGGTGAAGTGGTGGTGGGDPSCEGTYVRVPKRLVRLTSNQLVNTYGILFDAAATATIVGTEDIPPATSRSFPPLASGGPSIGDNQWGLADRLGQGAMRYVGANLAALTQCGAMPTDATCGQNYVLAFAEKAFRHPITNEERTALTDLWTAITMDGGSVSDAMKYGIYGVLSSPSFLYRTEYGADPLAEGRLTPYEIASELSYFVADAPPDPDLLAAAAAKTTANQPFTGDEIRMHITRLLGLPSARANLEAAMIAYFQLPSVPTVVIDPPSVPGITVTGGLLASMYHEGELFMKNTLWTGTLSDILTSRQTWVNDQIAMPIYGVAAPTQRDADGFGPIMLSTDRTGLLTLSPFLASKARPDNTSVVGRGLAINAALLCQDNPVIPEPRPPEIDQGIQESIGLSSKAAAEKRRTTPFCAGCHAQFDGFGLVLEPYDSLGRFRMADLMGNPIDETVTTTTLPDAAGGGNVRNAVETAQAILASGALDACMAMNLMNFALSDVSQGGAGAPSPQPPPSSCAVKDVVTRFNSTDKSFLSLIREIAASDTLAIRSRGM
jgi:hypothetical protein